jgi:hypothetical protein
MFQVERMDEAIVALGLSSRTMEVLPPDEPLVRGHDLVVLEVSCVRMPRCGVLADIRAGRPWVYSTEQ